LELKGKSLLERKVNKKIGCIILVIQDGEHCQLDSSPALTLFQIEELVVYGFLEMGNIGKAL